MNVDVKHVYIEYSNDVMRSIIDAALVYLRCIKLKGLVIKPVFGAVSKKMKFFAQMQLIKENIVDELLAQVRGARRSKEEVLKEREEAEKKMEMRKEKKRNIALMELDQVLKTIDVKAIFKLQELKMDILSNLDEFEKKRKNHCQLSLDPLSVHFVKKGPQCGFSGLGVNVMTRSTIETFMAFNAELLRTLMMFTENPII